MLGCKGLNQAISICLYFTAHHLFAKKCFGIVKTISFLVTLERNGSICKEAVFPFGLKNDYDKHLLSIHLVLSKVLSEQSDVLKL